MTPDKFCAYSDAVNRNRGSSFRLGATSVIGPGTREGYGDIFDTMGMAYSGTKQHFHSKYKNHLNWVTSGGVKTVTASGTNRLYRHDHGDATNGYRGLKIARGSMYYWVDFRQLWTANRWAMSGVILHWVSDGGGNTDLLDTTPDTENGKDDSPIVLGRT